MEKDARRTRLHSRTFLFQLLLAIIASTEESPAFSSSANPLITDLQKRKDVVFYSPMEKAKILGREIEMREREENNFNLQKKGIKKSYIFPITDRDYSQKIVPQFLPSSIKNDFQKSLLRSYKGFSKHKRKLKKNRSFTNSTGESNELNCGCKDSVRTKWCDYKIKTLKGIIFSNRRRYGRAADKEITNVFKNRDNSEEVSDEVTFVTNKNHWSEFRTNSTSSSFTFLFLEATPSSKIFDPNSGIDSLLTIKSVQPVFPQSRKMMTRRLNQTSSLRREEQFRGRAQRLQRSDASQENGELPVHKRTSVQYSSLVGPSFLNATANARTHALAGQTARLNCIIKNLHNYTVSWIRASDINLLTSGHVTYSSDNRFVAGNPSNSDRWVLKIHHVRLSDAGKYLCQISTSPPVSTHVTLVVTEAVSEVFPASEVFLKVGSRVRLICTIRGCPYPALPAWYRGRELQKDLVIEESSLTFVPTRKTTYSPEEVETSTELAVTTADTMSSTYHNLEPVTSGDNHHQRSKINTSLLAVAPSVYSTESSEKTLASPTPVVKEILVARVILERPKATLALSGTYSCTNTCTPPLNLTLHVLIGDEETAAMQHINGALSLDFWSYENRLIRTVLYVYLLVYR